MHLLRCCHDLLGRLAGDAHIQAVILGIVTFDLQFRQVVFVQQLCQCANERDICIMGVLSHINPRPLRRGRFVHVRFTRLYGMDRGMERREFTSGQGGQR